MQTNANSFPCFSFNLPELTPRITREAGTDINLITILLAGSEPGLQVLNLNNEWVNNLKDKWVIDLKHKTRNEVGRLDMYLIYQKE